MFDLALSVNACLRSGTRADVAWLVEPYLVEEAVALTPGGGRIGSLANGAFDSLLTEVAAMQAVTGRRIDHEVSAMESAVSGLPEGTAITILMAPATLFPEPAWPTLAAREPVVLALAFDGQQITRMSMAHDEDVPDPVRQSLAAWQPALSWSDDGCVVAVVPVTKLLVAGQGPIAEALAAQGRLLGWQVVLEQRPDAVLGHTAGMANRDAVVVMGHDVETSSRSLMSALESEAGYIGALGSHAMQQSRADWLAYRDVHDLRRVHGPAGIDIGARGPAQIAVSICAEIIADLPD